MQTKLVIEMVVDFRDKNKLLPYITAAKRAAARLNASAQLLADGQPPDIVCYSEDFFAGRTDLEYLFEEIEQEQAKVVPAEEEPAFSEEYLKALRGE